MKQLTEDEARKAIALVEEMNRPNFVERFGPILIVIAVIASGVFIGITLAGIIGH